jgi:hypothetical protein
MKIVITERQYKRILREEDELLLKKQQLEKVLHIPSLRFFNGDWDLLQKFLKSIGNPPYTIGGNLVLFDTLIKSLGNLISVGGNLYFENSPIESLGNLTSVGGYVNLRDTPIESLGNLTSVGGNLRLSGTPIKSLGNLISVGDYLDLSGTAIKSLGNLTSVGGDLYLEGTPLSKKYTEYQIKQMVDVGGEILLK